MALLTTNIDYSGKMVNEIMQKIFVETPFYKTFGARQIVAIKSKYFYFDISNSFEFAPYECCPTVLPGNITLNQRTRDLCEFMMTGKVCHKDLISTAREMFYVQGMNAESMFDDTQLISALTANIIKTASEQLDDIILNGNTAGGTGTYLDLCDGLLTKWAVDPAVVDVTAVPGNITPTGIVGELNKMFIGLDPTLLYNTAKPLKIAVSIDIALAYQQFLASNAFMNPNAVDISLNYMGVTLIPVHKLPAATMFMTYSDNVILVTDDMNDFSQLTFKDQSINTLCDEIHIKLQGRSGVDYGYGEYVVLYS
jgi:hypothetical protein